MCRTHIGPVHRLVLAHNHPLVMGIDDHRRLGLDRQEHWPFRDGDAAALRSPLRGVRPHGGALDMTKTRKIVTLCAIVGGIVLLVVVSHLASHSSGEKVEMAKVETRTIKSSILASGQLQYRDPVELKPEVIGKISEIPVVEGQRVSKGQVVLRLDPQLFQAEVAQQQANVEQAQVAITSQQLTINNL